MSTRRYFTYFKYFTYVILGLLVIYSGIILFSKEGFMNTSPQQMTDDQQITAFMTTASEFICPTYDTVLEESVKEFNGTEEEKRQLAIQKLTKEAEGALFPCPPPNDPLAVPADIEERIKRTVKYFNSQLTSMNKKIESSLDCPPAGFEDFVEPFAMANVCREEDLQIREKTLAQEASKSAATRCIAPRDLDTKQRKEILAARKTALVRVMTDKAMSQALAKLKGDTQELKEFKKSLMEGNVKSNCPT